MAGVRRGSSAFRLLRSAASSPLTRSLTATGLRIKSRRSPARWSSDQAVSSPAPEYQSSSEFWRPGRYAAASAARVSAWCISDACSCWFASS